jgi:hypothetical protein
VNTLILRSGGSGSGSGGDNMNWLKHGYMDEKHENYEVSIDFCNILYIFFVTTELFLLP